MFTPLSKLAEPPPPKGVSSAQWDKILEDTPVPTAPQTASSPKVASVAAAVRATQKKLAQAAAFEQVSAEPKSDACEELLSMKLAQASDAQLLKVAYATCATSNTADVLRLYAQLGGGFEKAAFGTPMFQSMPPPTAAAPAQQPQAPRATQPAARPTSRAGQPTQSMQGPQSPSKPQSPSAGMSTPAVRAPTAGLGNSGASPMSQ